MKHRAHISYGDHRLLRFRHRKEQAVSTKAKTRIQMEVHPDIDFSPAARAAGDAWLLRGIPMVGVRGGVGGAIPGTRPDSAAA